LVERDFPVDLLKALSRPLDVEFEALSSLFVIKQGTFIFYGCKITKNIGMPDRFRRFALKKIVGDRPTKPLVKRPAIIPDRPCTPS
jgi:hypothetical protein